MNAERLLLELKRGCSLTSTSNPKKGIGLNRYNKFVEITNDCPIQDSTGSKIGTMGKELSENEVVTLLNEDSYAVTGVPFSESMVKEAMEELVKLGFVTRK